MGVNDRVLPLQSRRRLWKRINPDATGRNDDRLGATQIGPYFTRPDLGAGLIRQLYTLEHFPHAEPVGAMVRAVFSRMACSAAKRPASSGMDGIAIYGLGIEFRHFQDVLANNCNLSATGELGHD